MNILVSNDDGVHAKGLMVLTNAMRALGRVEVMAPDRDRSGASNSLTIAVPLRVNRLTNGFYSVTGTPTDCVNLALSSDIFDCKFDLVLSGINHNANLGDDLLYSGTVAAATEGRRLGLPSIALSLANKDEQPLTHFTTVAEVAVKLVKALLISPMPTPVVLNVNVPDLPVEQLQGFELTRLGRRHLTQAPVVASDPRGNRLYWIGNVGKAKDDSLGTDFYAIKHNRVSITPVYIDLTSYNAFEQVSHWLNKAGLQLQ